jgi:hypothetical protein
MRLIISIASLIALLASAAAAETTPWSARTTDFGLTAVGTVDVAPNTPATKWNVLAVGLFCGTPKLGPQVSAGKIYFYLYGIAADRGATGKPLQATVTADGAATDLTFGFLNDAAVTAVAPEFARRLMAARSASVLVKDYNSPDPDAVTMGGAAKAIGSALQRCLR